MTDSKPGEAPQPSYFWQWILVIAPIALGLTFLPKLLNPPVDPQSIVRPAPGSSNWFLIVRMPEAPPNRKTADAAVPLFDQWLTSLTRAGFQPMLLSEILNQQKRGLGLPDKAVVLVFDPAYRYTYEKFGPLLKEHHFPAVWLTSEERLKKSDLRYVSLHVAEQMKKSGLWDVAVFREKEGPFGFLNFDSDSKGAKKIELPYSWVKDSAYLAFNRMSSAMTFHRVNTRLNLTALQLVDQLNVEVPLKEMSALLAKTIDGKVRGLAVSPESQTPPAFNLQASPDRRVAMLWWPSTEGQNNFMLEMKLSELVGELWLSLRANEQGRSGIRIGITQSLVSVDEEVNGNKKQLLVLAPSGVRHKPFQCKVVLVDSEMKLYVNNREVWKYAALRVPNVKDGRFGLMLYDRIRGSAQANGLEILFNPLSKDLIKAIQSFSN